VDIARKAITVNPRSIDALRLYVSQMKELNREAEAEKFLGGLIEAEHAVPEMQAILEEL